MADYTATAHVFPSANDVRGSLAAGWGKTMYESNVGPYLANILSQGSYAFSGLVLPATSASLSITVGAGTAMISGYYVAVDATAVTVGASVTSFCYLKLTLDSNNNVSAVKYETNTTGTQPTNSILVGKIVSGGSTITSTNQDGMPFGVSHLTKGPIRIGAGSTRTLETFTSATGNLNGIHFYSGDVTLNAAHTLTVPAGKRRIVIVANGIITISGTINASGAGAPATAVSPTSQSHGTDQPGGGGGHGGAGGDIGGGIIIHGIVYQAGGAAGNPNGTAGTQLTGAELPWSLDLFSVLGGAAGGAISDAVGGAGGGSIVLIAPVIVLAATAILNTSGGNGVAGTGGAGGGGAGNVYIATRSYTDNGCTFTMTGGAGATSGPSTGGAGANGVKQINIY